MKQRQTTIEWSYQPQDFFGPSYHTILPDYEIDIDAGNATIVLNTPSEPVPEDLLKKSADAVIGLFMFRQMQTRRDYQLFGRKVIQQPNGRISYCLEAEPGQYGSTGAFADFPQDTLSSMRLPKRSRGHLSSRLC